MLFNSASPLSYPQYQRNQNTSTYQASPQEVEFMMKQKFNQSQNQQYMNNAINTNGYMPKIESDPYTELKQIIGSCSISVRDKILSDEEYIKCDNVCEQLVKQAIEEAVIPQLLQTPPGRMNFEKLTGLAKKLKEKYISEEQENNKQIQLLMQDEVVKNRLRELIEDKSSVKFSGQPITENQLNNSTNNGGK